MHFEVNKLYSIQPQTEQGIFLILQSENILHGNLKQLLIFWKAWKPAFGRKIYIVLKLNNTKQAI